VTKEEFDIWKLDPTTREFLGSMNRRINDIKDQLLTQAGFNAAEDRFLAGMAHAYSEVRDVSFEDTESA
jgi:hypothetical protein